MTSRAQEILRQTLDCPVDERAELAAELLASLDDAEAKNPAEVEAAWAAEIESRARRVLAGEPPGLVGTTFGDARKPNSAGGESERSV